MRRFRLHQAILGVVLGLFCSAAAGQSTATATVNVRITVLPYAEVTLDVQSMSVTISQGRTSWSVSIGGTVVCNCPVSLSADVTPPPTAPAGWTWSASTKVAKISTPGSHEFRGTGNQLLTVTAAGDAAAAGSFDLTFTGQGLPRGSTPGTPGAGEVIVTVVPD